MPKLCGYENCRNVSSYGINCEPIRCKKHKDDNMKLSSSLCKCGKQPSYNLKGLTAKFCSDCKPENAIDVKNKKCNFESCNKTPNYNYANELNAIYCKTHSLENMIDINHKRCNYNECSKIPSFNYECEKAPIRCFIHREPEMINFFFKKCCYLNCKTTAYFNYDNEKKPIYCSLHKEENMINIISKICIHPNCKVTPSYNYENEKTPIYCNLHKINQMVNVKSKYCLYSDCNLKASFNYINEKSPLYCAKHKFENMENILCNKCLHEGCKTQPFFNYNGETSGKYCIKHKTSSMIDVVAQKCKADNCQTRANKNYKDYCANCYQHLFPLDPLTFQIRCKTKEIAVRDFINTKFEGFQHDKPLWYNESACDCTTKRRIDHRKLINGTMLCIETDENQHKSYSKADEEARYNDVFMAYGGKFVFIRFNPDKYKDENGKSCNPMLFNRLIVLEEEINKQIQRIEKEENNDLLEVVELYYDKKTKS